MTNQLVTANRPPSLRARKKLAQKEHIFGVALQLFRAQGYDLTTVEAICQAAQVSRQTFFNYFPRKDSVLNCWGEGNVQRLHDALGDRTGFPDALYDQVIWVFQHLIAGFESQRDLLCIVVFEILRSAAAMATDRLQRQNLGAIFFNLCLEASRRGELPARVSPARLAALVESLYIYTFLQWLEAEQPFPLEQELVARLDCLWQGVAGAPAAARRLAYASSMGFAG